MKPTFTLRSLVLGCALITTTTAFADILTWDNGAGTGNWNVTDNNWSGLTWFNNPPDDAVFGEQAAGTVTLTEPITVGSITLNAAGYTLDASTFGITINTGITANEGAAIQSGVGGSIILGAANAWSVAADQTLAVGAPVSGDFALTKTGAGVLELSGAGSYTGNTNLNGGTLRLAGGDDRLPTATRLVLANTEGVTFDLNGFNQEARTLSGGGTTGGIVTNTGSGTSTLTIQPAGSDTLSFNGVIAGDTRLEVVGGKTAPAFAAPRQRLAGINSTFTGGVLIDGATVLAQGDGAFGAAPAAFDPAAITLQNNGTLLNNAVGAVFAIHPNRGITLGPGGGAMTAGFTTNITVESAISGDAGNPFTIMANNGIMILTADNPYGGDTVIRPVDGIFQARLQLGDGGTTGSLSGTSAILNDGILIINRSNGFTQAADLNNQVIAGDGAFTQAGAGTTTLSLDNTYTGITSVSGGVLLAASAEAIPGGLSAGGTGSGISLSGGGVLGLGAGDFTRIPFGSNPAPGEIAFLGNGGFAAYGADRTVNFGGGGGTVAIGSTATPVIGSMNGKTLILGAADATHKVTLANTLDFGNASRTIQVTDGLAAVDAEISGVIQQQVGGFAGFNKTGDGTLGLSNTNTYNGQTNVAAGTLVLDGSLANANMTIAAGAEVNGSGTLTFNVEGAIADQVVNEGTLDLSGLTLAVNAIGDGLTEAEYVLVDATLGGTITGTFAEITGAPGYTLDYGTVGQVKLVGGAPVDPYESWSAGAAFDGDSNGDGVSNGLAFLLGAADPDVDARGLLPTAVEDAGTLVLNFSMRDAGSRGSAALFIEFSSDLGISDPWQEAEVPDVAGTVNDVVFTVDGAGLLDLQATISATQAENGRLFGRLKATKP